MIMLQTSLSLKKLGIQGPHKIEAHFDQDVSLIFFIYFVLFSFSLFYFIFIATGYGGSASESSLYSLCVFLKI